MCFLRSGGYEPSSKEALRPKKSPSPFGVSDALLSDATTVFRRVQEANNREDREALAELVEGSYLEVLVADFGDRATPSETRVHHAAVLGNRVLGFERQVERFVGSIHFRADISEGSAPSEEVEEVWHFVRTFDDGARWKLAGIETMPG